MEAKILVVEDRQAQGSTQVRRLRKTGFIPGVVYSDGSAATSVALPEREYHLAVRGCKPVQLFKFQSKNSALDGVLTLIKSVQVEPIKGEVLHVDFIAIHEGHRLSVTVPVEITGESVAVKENRAILNQAVYEIEVECLPSAIPSVVQIDISGLDEGETLHAADIKLPEGVRLKSIPRLSIVSALSKKAMEEEAAAQEAAAAAAKAAGTPAATPAAGTAQEGQAAAKK